MWRRTTLQLTVQYSLLFLGFLWLFSAGIYAWVHESLGQSYVEQVQSQLEKPTGTETPENREQAVKVAAGVAIDRFKNALLTINTLALLVVPFGAWLITKRTLRPLIASQEQQKQFVANASHELRTPLAVLSGELELALKSARVPSYYRRTLKTSRNEVERMIQLSNQLLLLNQIDVQSAGRSLGLEKVDLLDSLYGVSKKYQPLASQRRVKVQLDVPATPLLINASTQLIETAIGNVIQNAIKYAPESSVVTATLATGADRTQVLIIRNVSQNMTQAEATKLFQRFYRAKKDIAQDGFGLGLPITKNIVELYGGSATIELVDNVVSVKLQFKRG